MHKGLMATPSAPDEIATAVRKWFAAAENHSPDFGDECEGGGG